MPSYRASLAKIGVAPTARVSYLGFASRPKSLRAAIASMDFPSSQSWSQVSDIFRDDDWTDEVQGVAWDGSRWIFSANANQLKPGHNDKAIYVFEGGKTLADGNWLSRLNFKDVPHPASGTTESDDHWGQVCFFDGLVHISHFWNSPKHGASVFVFKDKNGVLQFSRWIELDEPASPTDGRHEKAEFQAINPWDGALYTCFGSGDIHEFFIHDPNSGKWTGKTLKFDAPVTQVQGACFSPNGHLYIASNRRFPTDTRYQTIWYYSALNGHRLGAIPVLAEEDDQELEGICFADVSVPDGRRAQIHAVLLENRNVALDNLFFKSFASAEASAA